MRLRRLTVHGIEQFSAYLDNLAVEPSLAPPRHLLSEAGSSEDLEVVAEVEGRQLLTRLDAAAYLDQLLPREKFPAAERDAGVWAWLALFYFDQLCPLRQDGTRKRLEVWRYLPAVGNYQKYFRHFLLGPFVVFRGHEADPARISAILANRLHITDDLMEQIAGYQDLITNPAVLGTQTILYYDKVDGKLKYGARGDGPGTPRRLAAVLRQFDLTYDLYGMSALELEALLPKEFDRFRD